MAAFVLGVWACSSPAADITPGGSGASPGTGGSNGGTAGVAVSGAGGTASGGSAGSPMMGGVGGVTAGAGGVTGGAGAATAGTGAGGTTAGQGASAGVGNTGGSGGVGAGAGAGGSGGVSPGGAGGVAGEAGASFGGASGAPGGGAGAAAGGLSSGGAAGAAGASGGATGPFVCNQWTGGALMDELFNAGLESGLDGARWQLKWKNSAAIEEWANAQSTFWDAPIESACTNDTTSPDRIVFMIFSWTVETQADWRTKITQAVNNFRTKYPGLLRIDFMNQIRGPDNMLCPTPPAAGETIVVSTELEAAMQEVAAAFPGFVFLSPAWEARSCSDFEGGGPHLTTAANMAAAGPAATYFALTQ